MRAMVGSKPILHLGGRHSRRVDRLRFLLPTIALSLLAVVMAWPWLTGGYHGMIVPVFKSMAGLESDVMRMSKPRYVGRTKAAEAYEVTASSAFLDPADPDRIHLDQLSAVLEQTGASAVHLSADEGVYLRKQDVLELDGDLELTFGEGYRFTTESAHVDLGRGQVTGADPVTGEGPVGALAADRFDIEDGGKRLRFEGRVQVTIRPKAPAT
ncbi:MAG: LPS export ABC transporter periplasmic protein LptC [Alphaproteobacteria bacterium]|nr:LPS export ABC transporter periplasmic protein LptC [Alphaproteobacteria bacterium]